MRQVICNIYLNAKSGYEQSVSTISRLHTQLDWVTLQPILIGGGRQRNYRRIEASKGMVLYAGEGKVQFSLLKVLKFYRILKREKARVIHCHDKDSYAIAGLANILLRRTIILTLYDELFDGQNLTAFQKLKFRLAFFLIRLIGKPYFYITPYPENIEKVVSVFGKPRKSLQFQLGALPEENADVTIVEKHLENIVMRLNSKKKMIIGIVEDINSKINFEYLFETIDEILRIRDDAVFLIFGDGSNKSRLLAMIRGFDFGDSVQYLGKVENVFGFYPHFDLLLSISTKSATSEFVWQAMQYSVPVAAFKQPELEKLTQDGECLAFIDNSDFHNAAAQLNALLNDKTLRQSIASQAKSIVRERYSNERFQNFFNSLYKTLTEKTVNPDNLPKY